MKNARFAILGVLGLACSGGVAANSSLGPTDAAPRDDLLDSSTGGREGGGPSEPATDGANLGFKDDDAGSTTGDAAQPSETNPVLSLDIIPKTAQSTVLLYSARFYAWANRRDGSRTDVTDTAKWTSSSSRIAYLYSPGIMMPLSPGIATVEAALEGASDTASLTVDGVSFQGFTLDVPIKVLAVGDTEDLALSANYADRSLPINGAVAWESSPAGVVEVSALGQVVAVGGGSALVQAKLDGEVVASVQLIVESTPLRSIAITPARVDVNLSNEQQFVAMGTFGDSSVVDLTTSAVWSTGDARVVTVNGSIKGWVQSQSIGIATIAASWHDTTGSAEVRVLVGSPNGIAVEDMSIHRFESQPIFATGTYPNGSYDITEVVSWSLDDPTIASVATIGKKTVVTGQKPGATNLHAKLMNNLTGTARVTVLSAALVSVDVSPTVLFIPPPQRMRATATYDDQAKIDVSAMVTWKVADSNVAIVSNAPGEEGLVTSVAAGMTSITATLGPITGTGGITAFR